MNFASVRHLRSRLLLTSALACGTFACGAEAPFPNLDELEELRQLQGLSRPPDSKTNAFASSPAAVALGQRLFADTRFSSCGISCETCHPAPTFNDGRKASPGCNGLTERTAPSLLNASFGRWFYWDGRKDSLWSHAILPLRELEMNAPPETVREKLQQNYRAEYAALFGAEPAAEPDVNRVLANFGKSIEAFLRTLIQVNAPFDEELSRYVNVAAAGDASGDPLHLKLKTFVRTGRCTLCHKGPMLADDKFHNIGVDAAGIEDQGWEEGQKIVLADTFNGASIYSDDVVTGRGRLNSIRSMDGDSPPLGAFKTPSLRNVAVTAPYMHNGRYTTLDEVIEFYDRGGDKEGTFTGERAETVVKLELSKEEKRALKELLESMTAKGLLPY
ncbi:MAG TPA: cytochrome c peroxidase [Myxococcaceae bacterium]|nr:cytochrome c peroxidase [Myxococcaceae bacterium]